MGKRIRLTGYLSIAVLLAPIQALACQIWFHDYNQHRRITGDVGVECPNEIHTAPFGNWGVESIHGSRSDANQFRGWKPDPDGTLHWNSCTTHFDFRPPNCDFYNYPASVCTSQYNDPIDTPAIQEFANYFSGDLPWSCSEYGGIYTLNNYFMELWELDTVCCDDYVATLNYPSFNVVLSEGPTGYWSGWSDAYNPSSITGTWPNFGTAQLKVFIEMWETF